MDYNSLKAQIWFSGQIMYVIFIKLLKSGYGHTFMTIQKGVKILGMIVYNDMPK